MKVGYARVSTDEQSLSLSQIDALTHAGVLRPVLMEGLKRPPTFTRSAMRRRPRRADDIISRPAQISMSLQRLRWIIRRVLLQLHPNGCSLDRIRDVRDGLG
jgi:hypothetical protein